MSRRKGKKLVGTVGSAKVMVKGGHLRLRPIPGWVNCSVSYRDGLEPWQLVATVQEAPWWEGRYHLVPDVWESIVLALPSHAAQNNRVFWEECREEITQQFLESQMRGTIFQAASLILVEKIVAGVEDLLTQHYAPEEEGG